MAQDLVSTFPVARRVFEEADAALGFPLSTLCFEGPEADLRDTINAQPALLAHSIAALRVLEAETGRREVAFMAGHSLGEYSALVAAGALELADGLLLVRERGRVMKAAGDQEPGMMASVLGMDEAPLEDICRETGVQIANYNTPGHNVISGRKQGVEQAIALAKERGAKRIIPLAVSIASHCRCMESAAQEFSPAVSRTPLRPPKTPVISNVSGRPLGDAGDTRRELVDQLTSPVQWVQSVNYMVAQGVTDFVEIGPKDVLAGLIRRINKEVHAVSIGDVASIKAFGGTRREGA